MAEWYSSGADREPEGQLGDNHEAANAIGQPNEKKHQAEARERGDEASA